MDQGTCTLGEGDCSKTGKLVLGWCQKHYQRIRKGGDPSVSKRIFGDDVARFWSYVERRGDDECWIWTGHLDDGGYGVIGIGKKLRKAHCWAYGQFVGAMPEGLPRLDHKCHTDDDSCLGGPCIHRRCVNYLRHLDPVTDKENAVRSHQGIVSDGQLAALHERWRAGEPVAALALEVGVVRSALYNRFRRMNAA